MNKSEGELQDDELRTSAFHRIAWVLKSFWEEQKNVIPRKEKADVHSRLFDTLIHAPLISIGTSQKGGGHIEHVVPCAYIRDKAFEMFWSGKNEADVAKMVGRLLRIAHITKEEAHEIDHVLGYKSKMPSGWDFETDSILVRLELCGIKLE